MKKTTRLVCLFVCVLLFCTSCSAFGSRNLSAYEIARKNGYTGSESEWLDSLKGENAYELWLKAGNTGSLDDFFASLSHTQNNYDITIEGEDTTTEAASKGLLSVVSVYSNFTTTVYVRDGLGYKEVPYHYSSAGSGVIYQLDKGSGSAYIITNFHVVYDGDNETTQSGVSADINLYLYGMQAEQYAIDATYVGGSKYYDIAVLEVKDSDILSSSQATAVELADSNEISVGETAIAIGNPEALGISATAGIICVDSEFITMKTADNTAQVSMRVMRIDTAINSGNSGGALYNGKGQLVGITNAKIVDQSTENIAYAIPSNIAVGVAQNIIDTCVGTDKEVMQRCVVGVSLATLSSKAVYDSAIGKVLIEESVSVSAVDTQGLAYGHISVGDIICGITVGGAYHEVSRTFHVIDAMLGARVGDTVVFHIVREGIAKDVPITITADCVIDY